MTLAVWVRVIILCSYFKFQFNDTFPHMCQENKAKRWWDSSRVELNFDFIAETTLQNKIEKEKEVAQEQLILISDPYYHFEPRQAVIPLAKRNSMLQEAYGTHFGPIGKQKNSENCSADPQDWRTQHARSRSHIDTPPKHSLKVASSCAPTTRCSCPMILHEATDCQHTNHC